MSEIDPRRERLFEAAKSHFHGRGKEYRRNSLSMDVYTMCLSLAELDKHKDGLIDMPVSEIARAMSVPAKRVDNILRHEAAKPNGIIARVTSRKRTDPVRYRINMEALAKVDTNHRQKMQKLEQAKERYHAMLEKRQEALAARQTMKASPAVRRHNVSIGGPRRAI